MDVTQVLPPVSGFLQVKLDPEIIDYLWKIIEISKKNSQNYKQHLAGNISRSFLLDDQDSFFFKDPPITALPPYLALNSAATVSIALFLVGCGFGFDCLSASVLTPVPGRL